MSVAVRPCLPLVPAERASGIAGSGDAPPPDAPSVLSPEIVIPSAGAWRASLQSVVPTKVLWPESLPGRLLLRHRRDAPDSPQAGIGTLRRGARAVKPLFLRLPRTSFLAGGATGYANASGARPPVRTRSSTRHPPRLIGDSEIAPVEFAATAISAARVSLPSWSRNRLADFATISVGPGLVLRAPNGRFVVPSRRLRGRSRANYGKPLRRLHAGIDRSEPRRDGTGPFAFAASRTASRMRTTTCCGCREPAKSDESPGFVEANPGNQSPPALHRALRMEDARNRKSRKVCRACDDGNPPATKNCGSMEFWMGATPQPPSGGFALLGAGKGSDDFPPLRSWTATGRPKRWRAWI